MSGKNQTPNPLALVAAGRCCQSINPTSNHTRPSGLESSPRARVGLRIGRPNRVHCTDPPLPLPCPITCGPGSRGSVLSNRLTQPPIRPALPASNPPHGPGWVYVLFSQLSCIPPTHLYPTRAPASVALIRVIREAPLWGRVKNLLSAVVSQRYSLRNSSVLSQARSESSGR
jgi:hypothetical protein